MEEDKTLQGSNPWWPPQWEKRRVVRDWMNTFLRDMCNLGSAEQSTICARVRNMESYMLAMDIETGAFTGHKLLEAEKFQRRRALRDQALLYR
ncbi:hypothetical protein J6590_004084 [Homalodisca vitripennis]|nr:hypothetical protein J6590_004084 [Homalodisca vitripennis]